MHGHCLSVYALRWTFFRFVARKWNVNTDVSFLRLEMKVASTKDNGMGEVCIVREFAHMVALHCSSWSCLANETCG